MTDKKIADKVNKYISVFQDDIRQKIIELGFNPEKATELLEYLYNYPKMEITKEDLNKRQRAPNATPMQNRCNAKKCTGEQCTRKRIEGYEFCRTHYKSSLSEEEKSNPENIIPVKSKKTTNIQKLEVSALNLKGIVYYVDKYNNVYQPSDVLDGKENPRIIGSYEPETSEIQLNK